MPVIINTVQKESVQQKIISESLPDDYKRDHAGNNGAFRITLKTN